MWARSDQIYLEAESNASLLAIAEAQQYKWPSGQIGGNYMWARNGCHPDRRTQSGAEGSAALFVSCMDIAAFACENGTNQ